MALNLLKCTHNSLYYNGADFYGCGTWFRLLDRKFGCTKEGLYSTWSFEELTYYRAASSKATACAIIYLGELIQLHIVILHIYPHFSFSESTLHFIFTIGTNALYGYI